MPYGSGGAGEGGAMIDPCCSVLDSCQLSAGLINFSVSKYSCTGQCIVYCMCLFPVTAGLVSNRLGDRAPGGRAQEP